MNTRRTLGLAALAIGVVFIGIGFNATEAPLDQIHNTLTGRYTDATMWYFVGGFVGLIFGGLAFFRRI